MKISIEKTYHEKPFAAHRCGANLTGIEGHKKTVFLTDTDSPAVTLRARFDEVGFETLREIADVLENYPDEDTPLLDEANVEATLYTDEELREAKAIFDIEGKVDAQLLVKNLKWNIGKALLATNAIRKNA